MDQQTADNIKYGNINRLAEYMRDGIKPAGVSNVGIEIEHFVVDAQSNEAVSYYKMADGRPGVASLLDELSSYYTREERTQDGELVGLTRKQAAITLEPGAQFEISIGPCESVTECANIYDVFLSEITPILEKYSYKFVNLGYQPASKIEDIKIIPKKRYDIMDRYLGARAKHGRNMMRGTASTQVSVDYHSEEEASAIMRTASLLGPLFYLLCDNSPIFEGAPAQEKIRPVRMHIWDNVDPDRCGVFPGVFNNTVSFDSYAQYAYDAPALMAHTVTGGMVEVGALPANALYAAKEINRKDIEQILSMFFFDARMKNYVEIRMADSLPREYAFSYVALIHGIFANADNLAELENILADATEIDFLAAKKSIRAKRFDAELYGIAAEEWYEKLFQMAKNSLGEEALLLEPMQKLARNKTTLADRA